MSETQDSVYTWMQVTFPGTDPDSPRKSIRALEEMIELCAVSGASFHQIANAIWKSWEKAATAEQIADPNLGILQPEKIPAETADVDIVLDGIAGMRGFSRAEAKDLKMAVNRARRWKSNGDGTGYHIKEGPAS